MIRALHGVIDERFELEAEVASGGMGTIYRAHDRQTGGVVAIKLLRQSHSTSTARFQREAELLRGLEHPHIVRYVAHGDSPAPYLAMEWVFGPTLAEHLERTGVNLVEALMLGRQLTAALVAAHDAGIVHRDLKPSNVILRNGDLAAATLIDFGIARATDSTPLTRSGTTMGTPGYMAPEQARGAKVIDDRADTFALGCLLYECVTGMRAFSGANPLAVQTKICVADPDPPRTYCPELPSSAEALLTSMLAKPSRDRPSASDVGAALERCRDAGLLPGVRRRVGHALDVETQRAPSAAPGLLRCTVFCVDVAGQARRADEVEQIIQPWSVAGDEVLVLQDGSIAASFAGADPEIAERAARFALELQRVLPGALIVVTCDLDVGAAIERASRTVATAAIRAIFSPAGTEEPGVHVDLEVARRLGSRFRTTPQPHGALLHTVT
jgi:eukaryotic-like serine/threonine-protein kinase